MEENVKIKIDLFYPIFADLSYKDDIYDKFYKMILDIKRSSIFIKLDNKRYKIMTKFVKLNKNDCFYYKTLIVEFNVDFNDVFKDEEIHSSVTEEKEEITNLQHKYMQRLVAVSEIEKFIMDFTFAINLAHPGLFQFSSAKIFIDNKEERKNRINVIHVEWIYTYINYLKNNWPIIHHLKFEQVWNWLENRTNFFSGISKSAIDRALNSLTYTMGDNVSYEQIFYILIGIEALYNDNDKNGIAEQIRVKTESLLKRPEIFKKKISKFYDNRSKFIHGKLNFPNKFCQYDAAKDFEEFYFENYINTVEDAMSILLSTIQEYIINDASKMKTEVVTLLEK